MKSWVAAITGGALCGTILCSGHASYASSMPREPVAPITVDEQNPGGGGGAANAKPDAGGFVPCLLTCYIGPRVGHEYNEGRNVATLEWLSLIGPLRLLINLIFGLQAMSGKTMTDFAKENMLDSRPIPPAGKGRGRPDKGGIAACCVSCYLGPRVAFERNEGRAIRSKEMLILILSFIPLVNIIALVLVILLALEAYNGKTMTQVAMEEGLDG